MNEKKRLEEIQRKVDEISILARDNDYYSDVERLKKVLDYTTRALGMFTEMEINRLEEDAQPHDPIKYIEANLNGAYDLVMTPTKNGQFIKPPMKPTL